MDGSDVVASVVTPAFRRIDLRVAVNDDGTYQIMEWKATSEADSTVAEETLWSPVG